MLKQLYRFVIVGLFNTIIDFGVFNLLIISSGVKSGLPLLVINIVAISLAVANSYVFNRIWTFRSIDPNYRTQITKFLIASLIGMFINTAVVALFSLIPVPATFSPFLLLNTGKLLAAFLSASWNFWSYRNLVFKKSINLLPVSRSYVPNLISIIIPAYNEGNRLPERLQILTSTLLSRFPLEIIVVDDGSNDATPTIAHMISEQYPQVSYISHPRNQGKGKAVRTGMLAAHGEFLIFSDADNTFTPEHIETMIKRLQTGSKIVIACRQGSCGQRITGESTRRRLMGKAFNILVQTIFLPGIKDSQCGLKGFHHQAAYEIFSRQHLNRFAFDVEVLALAQVLKYEIAELPVEASDCPGSRVNPLLAPMQMLVTFLE